MIKKILISLGAAFSAMLMLLCVHTLAEELDYTVVASDGYDTSFLQDDDYFSTDYYMAGDTLTFTADENIDGIYIKWDTEPGSWTLTADGKESTHGENDFLHEYIKLDLPAREVMITIAKDRTYLADVYLFSAGELPDWVEVWEKPWDKADILFFSTHSDDEVLFFGGLIPTYTDKGYNVQVAYFCDFAEAEPYRRHEQLSGIWTMGVDHYPQLGIFDDIPLVLNTTEVSEEEREQSFASFDTEEGMEYVVSTIRRFKPMVLVAQDSSNGEYGHGAHIVCSQLVADAVEVSMDASSYPESADQYGVWDVPKTYLHLYPENQITVDARVPLNKKFGGRTAFEIAEEAYLKHESQQWMWFYVTDGDPEDNRGLNCTIFGLFRSTVGADTGNDIMEHVLSYHEQEIRQAVETTAAADTAATEAESSTEALTPDPGENKAEGGSIFKTILIILGILLGLLIIFMVVIAIISSYKKKKREEERRRRRQQQLRKTRTASQSKTQSKSSQSQRNSTRNRE